MNQLPAINPTGQDIELKFFQDWKKSYALIFQAIKEAPIATAFLITTAAMSVKYPKLPVVWIVLQAIPWSFLASKLIRRTYCQIIPEAHDHPELFARRPEWQMYGAQLLFNVGTIACTLLFIVPGIWFAFAHSLVQQIVVLENCEVGAAFHRSRELTKGNFFKFTGYVVLWPLISSIALTIGFALANAMFVLIHKATIPVDHIADSYVLKMFISYFSLVIALSCTTLMVRAYVQFTHKSGSLTAIEKQLNPEIAMQ